MGCYHNVLQETSYHHRIVPLFSGTFENWSKGDLAKDWQKCSYTVTNSLNCDKLLPKDSLYETKTTICFSL